jgi:hypothetical protein
MIGRWLFLAVVVLGFSVPAAAQPVEGPAMSASECQAAFAEADTNGDGVLSQQEIAASDLQETQAGTSLQEFVADCQS